MKGKKESFNDIVKSDKPTLVDFFATWCGPCKMMAPALKQVASEVSDDAKVLKIDIDKNQALANKLAIRSVPTIVIYKEGKIVWRQSGALSKDQMLRQLRKHMN